MRAQTTLLVAYVIATIPVLACGDDLATCVLEDGSCSVDCVIVLSASASQLGTESTCLAEDIVFGCAPDPTSGYYGNEGSTGQDGVCAVVRATGDTVCFSGISNLWWYNRHRDEFCASDEDCGFTIQCNL